MPVMSWRARLLGEIHALPVDLFRVLAGLVCAAYFLHRLVLSRDFGGPDGFIDHDLAAGVLWYTRLSLFQPGTSLAAIQAALALAAAACLGAALGWRIKACAAFALAVGVSWSRWTFLIIEIDDTVVQLMLFWLLLLPVGSTLTLAERLRSGPECWRRWSAARVPGLVPRLLMANVCLIYLVAGLWKVAAPMWRDGFALYAVLRLPMSRTRDLWTSADLPWLRAAGFAALALELALAFLIFVPRAARSGRLKWLGLLGQLGFHLGIVTAFGLPFVNLLLLSSAALFFREPLMERVFGAAAPAPGRTLAPFGPRERLAAALLAAIAISSARDVPGMGRLASWTDSALWLAGLAQDYRLFDWIETKNYRVEHEVLARDGRGGPFAPDAFIPFTTSAVLLQSYVHGVRWMYIPPASRPALRASILERAARRFCRLRPELTASLRARARTTRITPDDPDLLRASERPLLDFSCSAGAAVVEKTFL